MSRREDMFGIDIMKYCKQHEQYIEEQLHAGRDLERLYAYHNRRVAWLQHERLVHLLVTILTAVAVFFLFRFEIELNGNAVVLLLLSIFIILAGAYLFHYFRLENTVQHWYKLSDRIYRRLYEEGKPNA